MHDLQRNDRTSVERRNYSLILTFETDILKPNAEKIVMRGLTFYRKNEGLERDRILSMLPSAENQT